MSVIHIFTTNPVGTTFEPFQHGNKAFTFDVMDESGPVGPCDAPIWAFLDWVMEDLSGLEMCRRLKADERTNNAHITMVLDRDNIDDRRRALEAGADDYILGPLDYHKVLERIQALFPERQRFRSSRIIDVGDFSVDLAAHLARYDGKPISVRPNQFSLLCYFLENPNQMFSREELVEALCRQGPSVNARTVDKWIARLRESLAAVGADHLLRTVHFKGYVLDAM
jgi:two-component system, OmpR family, phosphate regulon response regulator PhoB